MLYTSREKERKGERDEDVSYNIILNRKIVKILKEKQSNTQIFLFITEAKAPLLNLHYTKFKMNKRVGGY